MLFANVMFWSSTTNTLVIYVVHKIVFLHHNVYINISRRTQLRLTAHQFVPLG